MWYEYEINFMNQAQIIFNKNLIFIPLKFHENYPQISVMCGKLEYNPKQIQKTTFTCTAAVNGHALYCPV